MELSSPSSFGDPSTLSVLVCTDPVFVEPIIPDNRTAPEAVTVVVVVGVADVAAAVTVDSVVLLQPSRLIFVFSFLMAPGDNSDSRFMAKTSVRLLQLLGLVALRLAVVAHVSAGGVHSSFMAANGEFVALVVVVLVGVVGPAPTAAD